MRSFGLLSTAAVALVSMVSVAAAADHTHRTHRRHHSADVMTTGAVRAPARSASYQRSDLWPACLQGPPACTAAGYPNLHWYRETHGLPY
jgi:hypothetical protein